MSLAVSCTNDSYRVQALRVLKNWLVRNPRYADHPLVQNPEFNQGARHVLEGMIRFFL